MVEQQNQSGIKRFEKCHHCGADVIIKPANINGEYHQLTLCNPDGNRHFCLTEADEQRLAEVGASRPDPYISQSVIGQKITGFSLRGRRLSLTLEDGSVFVVWARNHPLDISVERPER